MLKATNVYGYEQGCKSMLSIGENDLVKSTIFRYWGKWFSKIDTSEDVQFFAQNKVKTKTKVITFADAQFWDMKILGGMLPDYWGDTSLYGFAPMVLKRFKIIEKLYFIQSIVENGWWGGGDASPTSPPGSAPDYPSFTSVCKACTI